MNNTILTPKFPHLLHGGDYNPDQWLDRPDILKEDIRLMKEAHINCVSLGIFAWAHLEPKKDEFDFGWLDEIIDNLYAEGIYVDLATPSGARPRWLAEEYPEVLRVDERGTRAHFGFRHNHCMTSPIYRERVHIINTELAKHYADHPAVIMWHISNEYSGECHCELCQEAFRNYLRGKYQTIERLNNAWWAHFWSHTYTSFDEIESPKSIGETSCNALYLDWRRFATYQTTDFMNAEIDALKAVNPSIPVTTNMMGFSDALCYPRTVEKLDFVSWDSYPQWHMPGENLFEALYDSMAHDYMRSLKKKPFILMESTPSTVNWRPISKIKKPGMHRLASLNAVGHGAQSVMYFQIRQSRGGPEKFHSAVISHVGTENTRVFGEVASLGEDLSALTDKIYASDFTAKVALIYDKECKWALDLSDGPRNQGLDYDRTCVEYYTYFWSNGINVDVLDSSADLDGYSIVITPMLYMYQNGIQERIRSFVADGGILIGSALSGVVDETDLCLMGEDTDEKLSDVYGMWIEERDSLYDSEINETEYEGDKYKLAQICEVVRTTTAEVMSTYKKDFYRGKPVITCNKFGKGKAYYIAACAELPLIKKLCERAALKAKLESVLGKLVVTAKGKETDGVGIVSRSDGEHTYAFIGNFADESRSVEWEKKATVISGKRLGEKISSVTLAPYEIVVVEL